MKPSPNMADELSEWMEDSTPFDADADYYMGQTDCDDGCVVEPDGCCPHGFKSAALTLGVI